MLTPSLATRAALDRNDDDGVDDRFSFFCRSQSLFVIDGADGVSPICDEHDDFAAFTMIEGARCQIDCVVECSGRSQVNVIDALVNPLQVRGVSGRRFPNRFAERVYGKTVDWTQDFMRESLG